MTDISSYQCDTGSGQLNTTKSSQDKQLDSYRGKVSNDELLQLAAHSTRQRLMKERPGSSSGVLSCSSLTKPPGYTRTDQDTSSRERPPVLVDLNNSPVPMLDQQLRCVCVCVCVCARACVCVDLNIVIACVFVTVQHEGFAEILHCGFQSGNPLSWSHARRINT